METPDFFQTGYYNSSEKQLISDVKNGEHFVVDDLLDLPNDEGMATDDTLDLTVIGNSTDCSVVHNSCNSSLSGSNHHPQSLGYRDFPKGHLSTEFALPVSTIFM